VIATETGAYWTDQLKNTDQLAAYQKLADEIWMQTEGRIDAFVQSVGTAASLRGTGEALRRNHSKIKIVAVEPTESAVLSGGPPGAHKIDGIGAGFVVPLWRKDVADQIERVSTEEATNMALRLAREEGLFAGTSTGANVLAALRVAEQLGPDTTIVTMMCDTGMKYLKTLRHSVKQGRSRASANESGSPTKWTSYVGLAPGVRRLSETLCPDRLITQHARIGEGALPSPEGSSQCVFNRLSPLCSALLSWLTFRSCTFD
jgi:threonine dehydratase